MTDPIDAALDAMKPELREGIMRAIKAIKKDGAELWLVVRALLNGCLAELERTLALRAQGRFPEMDGDRIRSMYDQVYGLYSAMGYAKKKLKMTDPVDAALGAMEPELREDIVRAVDAIEKEGAELQLAVRDLLTGRLAALEEELALHAQGRSPEMDGDRIRSIHGQVYGLYSAMGYDKKKLERTDPIDAALDAMEPKLRETTVRAINAIEKEGAELRLAVRDLLIGRLAALEEALALHAQGRFPEMDGDRLQSIHDQVYGLYSAMGYATEAH